jgi:purine-cytosine permease-like protein
MITILLGLSPIVPVPEGGSTFALLALVIAAFFLLHRRFSPTKPQPNRPNPSGISAVVIAVLFVSISSAFAGPAPVQSVPEAGQTLLLLGLSMVAVIALRYKLAK